MERLGKTPAIETSPEKKNQIDKKVDNPTAKATLDKDALDCKMTDWEYLMWLHHISPMAGHTGPKCTLKLLRRNPIFMRNTELTCKVKNYVKACIIYAQGKQMRQKSYGMLQPLPIPNRPWQDIAIEFIVKLPPSKDFLEPENPGYNSVWVVVNWFTKMICFLPYKKDTGADILARRFLKNIFANHGLSQSIVLDRSSVFAPKFTKAFYEALDVKRNLSTAFPPPDRRPDKAHQPDIRTVPLDVLQPPPG